MKSIYLILILWLLIAQNFLYSQNYNYSQSFETSNPFVYWTSTASYTINYFGLSNERASDGSYSLKMDITINGNGDKDCYYYWKLPVKTNLQGVLNFSADLFMDSVTAQYVKLGYHYDFPPTSIERTPTAVGIKQFNAWYTQNEILSEDVMYHADYFSKNKIYGSTVNDFGRELQFVQLIIRGKGSRRLIFYIDNVRLSGDILSPQEFVSYYTTQWNDYQSRLNLIKEQKHDQYNSLPAVPDTSNKKVSQTGIAYYNQLKNLRTDMLSLFNVIDNSSYFDTAIMDSLNYKLNLFPSLVLSLQNEMTNSASMLNVYNFPATTYNKLDETVLPSGLNIFDHISIRMCSNEYEPFTLLLQAKSNLSRLNVRWNNFTGVNGTIDSSAMDVSIAKVWYQAGLNEIDINNKLLTQELLIKNDTLIKVDKSTGQNFLLVNNTSGLEYYTDISTPGTAFPENVTVEDSKTLLPFSIPTGYNKQLWFTLHMPEDSKPGIYNTIVTICDQSVVYKTFTLSVEILPFKLDASRLIYGIYYNGYIDNYMNRPFHFTNKTETQMRIELKDMKDHGIMYPTTFQAYSKLDGDLQLRNEVGLPNDKLFAAGFKAGNSQDPSDLAALKSLVNDWKLKISTYGYKDLYVYGIDEGDGEVLTSEKSAWQAVHEAGGNIFVSGYNDLITEMQDLIDAGVVFGPHNPEQPPLYHAYGNYIFSYSNPQAGYENPEIYRRNYGLKLWKAGYDGAMDYAYQKNYGSTWNDFDGTKYRDQNFTYPITDGVLSTIQWEGFREGIDDVKYMSTLLNRIDDLKASGFDVTEMENWISSLDFSGSLDDIRSSIIDKILYLNNVSAPEALPSISGVSLMDSTTLKITFNKCIDPLSVESADIIIEPSVEISRIKVGTDLKSIYVKTVAHQPYTKYNLVLSNVTDLEKQPLTTNSHNYSYNAVALSIKVFLQGPYANGIMSTAINPALPSAQPFNVPPWNYSGSEYMSQKFSNVVDWVLLELRTDTRTVIYTKALLLRNDGHIIDTDGSENFSLYNIEPGNYFISIRHRNHLGIISSMQWYLSSEAQIIDLTTRSNVNTSCSLVKLDDLNYGMNSGDCDANGKVEIVDYKMVKQQMKDSGYYSGDVNLDGIVNDADYTTVKTSLLKFSPLD